LPSIVTITREEFGDLGLRDTTPSATGRNVAIYRSPLGSRPPDPVIARATRGGISGCLSWAGSTSGLTPAMQETNFRWIRALNGGDPDFPFELGPISSCSGGSRVASLAPNHPDARAQIACIEAPGLALLISQRRFPDDPSRWVRTWGHLPEVDQLSYGGMHSSIALSENPDDTTIANPLLQFLWVVEKRDSDPLDYESDVEGYLKVLEIFVATGFGLSGNIILGGGGVTALEILLSLRAGIPVMACLGTGRAADYLVALVANDELPNPNAEPAIYKWFKLIKEEGLHREMLETWPGQSMRAITLVRTIEQGQLWMQQMGMGRILR
jgi:hypothetical protein